MRRRTLAGLVAAAALVAAAGGREEKPQWQRVLQGDDEKKAAELEAQIGAAEKAERYREAIQAAERLLELRSARQGKDHFVVATVRHHIVALAKVSALSPEDRTAWRQALSELAAADALARQWKLADAQRGYEKALAGYRRTLGEGHPDTALSYNRLALLLSARARYPEAQPLFRKAVETCRQALGEAHPDTAACYDGLGINLARQGRHAEAQPLLQKALAARRETLGEAHADTAKSFSNAAANLGSLGRYTEALPLFRAALDARRATLGENHPETAITCYSLATNLRAQGRYAEAQLEHERALAAFRQALGEGHPYTGIGLSGLAACLSDQRKFAEALPLHRRGWEINRKALGEDHPDVALSGNNLAQCLQSLGRHAEALPLLERALDVYRRRLGENHEHTAVCLNNLAFTTQALGKLTQAQALFERALAAARRALGEAHPETALACYSLALHLAGRRRHTEAQPLFEQALEVRRKALGDIHPQTATSYEGLAHNRHALGRHAEALAALRAASRAYEAARLLVADRGADRALLGSARSPYVSLAAALVGAGQPAAAWQALESDFARGLLDETAARRPSAATLPEAELHASLKTRLAALQPLILRAVTRPEHPKELERLLQERAELEKRLFDLAATLSRREVASLEQVQAALPEDAALIAWVDAPATGGRISSRLGVAVRREGPPSWELLPGSGPTNSWAAEDVSLSGQVRQAILDGAASAEVEKAARRLAEQRLQPLRKHLDGVKRLFIIPVNQMAGVPVELLTDRHTVSYVPSGTFLARLKDAGRPRSDALLALGYPAFERANPPDKAPAALPPGGLLITQVLPGSAAATATLLPIQPGDVLLRYGGEEVRSADQLDSLIAKHAASRTVEVTLWREGEKVPAVRTVVTGRLGVVLDRQPAPEAVAARRQADRMVASLRGGTWGELPGTQVELASLGRLFAGRATLLQGSDASEQRLEQLRAGGQLANYRYLHFATHGEADNARAFESALVLAQDRLPRDLPRGGVKFHDGKVTAGEVLADWKLTADLVTLSACESGLGRPGGGDGLLGFAQAFLLAGARAVCLTLWKVDDAATALLMDRFYANLLGRRDGLKAPLGKAAALAEAKAWLRDLPIEEALTLTARLTQGVPRGKGGRALAVVPGGERKVAGDRPFAHPRYWAAFVLVGDPD